MEKERVRGGEEKEEKEEEKERERKIWLVGFLTSSSTTRPCRGRAPKTERLRSI